MEQINKKKIKKKLKILVSRQWPVYANRDMRT